MKQENLQILHLCTTDGFGAGSAVIRLHQSFVSQGFQSHVFTLYKLSSDPDVSEPLASRLLQPVRKWIGKITHEIFKRYYPGIIAKYSFFNFSESSSYIPSRLLLEKLPYKPNVIIVHFVSRFVNMRNIFELQQSTGAKVIFTMMDMAPMTGGCHYAWQCTGYLNECGVCPAISSKNPKDISNRSLLYKKHYLDKIDARLVVSTEWSHQQASISTLYKHKPITKIMLPVNEDFFKPGNKNQLRKQFGLPTDKMILLVGSFNLYDERKGFPILLEALKILFDQLQASERDQLIVVSIGKKDITGAHPFHHSHLGLMKGEKSLAEAYQLADVFACPSIEDAGPMMVNESILCGTPVVSFEMGASLDLVHYPDTGYRARLNDALDFALGIKTLFFKSDAHINLELMRSNCRELGLLKTSQSATIQQWRQLLLSLQSENGENTNK